VTPTVQDNAEQRDYWNADAGKSWVRYQAQLDRGMVPMTEALLAGVDAKAGDKVLDIGCGSGAVSLLLAERGCEVTGVDISALLLDLARQRAEAAKAPISFIEADAATYPLPPHMFDTLVSRFGVMFFADPIAAFGHLHGALRPGGRLRFACWQSVEQNPWVTIPTQALSHLTPPQTPPTDPHAPGPFAFANPERVKAILSKAGFQDVTLEPVDTVMIAGVGDDALEQAVSFYSKIGPAAASLRETDEETRRVKAPAALRAALAPYLSGDRLTLPAAIWLVSARA
jgi:SAM-dependent methyltransferase